MRVLVYGAGVIGCELAHVLQRRNNRVTLLARGAWKENLEKNGLVIYHYIQRKTTHDRFRIVDHLAKEEVYDIIFVTMQCNQIEKVLSSLAQNVSRYLVMVGNNPQPEKICRYMKEHATAPKEILFGFQTTGGRREAGKVISVHVGEGMTVGPAEAEVSAKAKACLQEAFWHTHYRLTWEKDMNTWLKSHLTLIMPIVYVCYATNCNLKKSTKWQRKAILEAAREGYAALKKMGIPACPAGIERYYEKGIRRFFMSGMLFIAAKTALGRLAASDHASHAVDEMHLLDTMFDEILQQAHYPMPTWQMLKQEMPSWEEICASKG